MLIFIKKDNDVIKNDIFKRNFIEMQIYMHIKSIYKVIINCYLFKDFIINRK